MNPEHTFQPEQEHPAAGWLDRFEGLSADEVFALQDADCYLLATDPEAYTRRLYDTPEHQRQWQAMTDADELRVGCMDERCRDRNVGAAGAGVLERDKTAFLQGISQIAAALGKKVASFQSHTGCGAAALACEQNHDDRPVDVVAEAHAHQAAEALGVKAVPQEVISLPFHCARVIYLTGTPTFNAEQVGLLPGFVISRMYHSDADATRAEATIARSIAVGAHGFGDRFTRDKPLLVVIVPGVDNEWTAERLLAEAKDIDFEGVIEKTVVLDVNAATAIPAMAA